MKNLEIVVSLIVALTSAACGSYAGNAPDKDSGKGDGLGEVRNIAEFNYEKKHSFSEADAIANPALSLTENHLSERPRYCELREKVDYFSTLAVDNIKEKFCNGDDVQTGTRYKTTDALRQVSYVLARLYDDGKLVVTKCNVGGTKIVTFTDTDEDVEKQYSVSQYYYGTDGEKRVNTPSVQTISKNQKQSKFTYMYYHEYEQYGDDKTQTAESIGHTELLIPATGYSTFFDQIVSADSNATERQRYGYKFNEQNGVYIAIDELEKNGEFVTNTGTQKDFFAFPDGEVDKAISFWERDFNDAVDTSLRVEGPEEEWDCGAFDVELDLSSCNTTASAAPNENNECN